jgi:hypothetical protein
VHPRTGAPDFILATDYRKPFWHTSSKLPAPGDKNFGFHFVFHSLNRIFAVQTVMNMKTWIAMLMALVLSAMPTAMSAKRIVYLKSQS